MFWRKKYFQFWIVWIVTQTSLFLIGFFKQKNDAELELLNRLGLSVYISRGAGLNLAVDSVLLILPQCRVLMGLLKNTPLRNIIPFDNSVYFHKVVAWTILFFTIIHTNAHYINFFNVETRLPELNLRAWAIHYKVYGGFTGHIMLMAMFFMYTSAVLQMRKHSFETFRLVHYLAIVWYICVYFHAFGCFVKTNNKQCRPYYSWTYILATSGIYLIERLYRFIQSNQVTTVTHVELLPGNAMQLQFVKPSMSYKPGRFVYINLPEIAPYQWHPFTLTSCPEEENISVHIRLVGDWTQKAARMFGHKQNCTNVKLRVDGPFCAPADTVFDYEHTILICAGIGVTPFASIIKSMFFKHQKQTHMPLKRVHLIWVNRDKDAFEWFQGELQSMNNVLPSNMLTIHMYLTNTNYESFAFDHLDTISNASSTLFFGRPNWDQSFRQIRDQDLGIRCKKDGKLQIGVFFCGPLAIAAPISDVCDNLTSKTVQFSFFKEHF